jgi:hypothetical protein
VDAGFVLRPMHVGRIDNALQRVDRTSVVARMTPTTICARRAGNGSTRMGRLISFPDAMSTPDGGVRWLRPSAHRVPIRSVEDIVNWSYGQVTGSGLSPSQEEGHAPPSCWQRIPKGIPGRIAKATAIPSYPGGYADKRMVLSPFERAALHGLCHPCSDRTGS